MATFSGGKIAMVKYRGTFDLYGLYQLIYDWLAARKFDVHEKVYKHKKSGPAYENERTLIGEKKESEYIKYKISVDFKLWTLKDVEVTKDGKKEKLQDARIRMFFNYEVEVDYTGEWSRRPFYEKMRNFFNAYVLKKELMVKHVDKLYYTTYKLQTAVKEHLGMETASSAY